MMYCGVFIVSVYIRPFLSALFATLVCCENAECRSVRVIMVIFHRLVSGLLSRSENAPGSDEPPLISFKTREPKKRRTH